MKKSTLLCLLFCFLFFLTACGNPPPSASPEPTYSYKNPDTLTPELVLQMREDYFQFFIDTHGWDVKFNEIWISKHFGTFGGCEIVYMGDNIPDTHAVRPVDIAGYTIVFPSGEEVYAYKNAAFLDLAKAYDAGWLTKEDILALAPEIDLNWGEAEEGT